MHSYALARFAADGILNSLLAGIAIAATAWAVSRLVHRQGSDTRFAVWFLALVAIVVFPWVGSLVASRASVPALATGAVTLPASFAAYLFIAWIVGATLGLSHVALGLYRLRRLRATCVPVNLEMLEPSLRAILAQGQRQRSVTLCTSEFVRVPAAIGYFRPMVVFPSWTLAELPTTELSAIVLHELAHLRRYDDWTNLAQKVAKAIFFFHPAVWFIESRLTLEREMACDDAVLAANFSPRVYAESLVGLAEKSFLRRGVQLAQAAVSHVQQLRLRLAEILRKDKQGSAGVRKPAFAVMSLAAIIATYGVSRAPRLVTFSSGADEAAAVDTSRLPQPTDFHLQPVNLKYTMPATAAQSNGAAGHHDVSKIRCRQSQVRNEVRKSRLRVLRASLADPIRTAADFAASEDLPLPALLMTNFPIDVTPSPVLVVFHGEQFGPDGPIFWRVTVVHLTPSQQRAITGGVPKQI